MIDGTAPHTVDPRYPGAVDEILNFGAYWVKEKLKKEKQAIVALTHSGSLCFSKTYAYLGAAATIYREWSRTNQRLTGEDRWRAAVKEIEDEISRRAGENRRGCNSKGRFRRLLPVPSPRRDRFTTWPAFFRMPAFFTCWKARPVPGRDWL